MDKKKRHGCVSLYWIQWLYQIMDLWVIGFLTPYGERVFQEIGSQGGLFVSLRMGIEGSSSFKDIFSFH
jgi:hypothetical protein